MIKIKGLQKRKLAQHTTAFSTEKQLPNIATCRWVVYVTTIVVVWGVYSFIFLSRNEHEYSRKQIKIVALT
jgi:hypothetical protein